MQVTRATLGVVLRRDYEGQVCSIARTLEILGDRWTLLIVRDSFLGRRRFDEFRQSLGVPTNVLADRLDRLVAAGIFERVAYSERPPRHEYRLTAKGTELRVALVALMQWGDRHLSGPPPRIVRRRRDGAPVTAAIVATDGALVDPRELESVPGPGARGAP
jgi:DNA-binding HxlR family transcriptional regulator